MPGGLFVHVLSYTVFERKPFTLLTTGQIMSVFLYVFHRNFLHYTALACKSQVGVEVNRK